MLLVDDLAAGGTKNLRHTPRGLVTLFIITSNTINSQVTNNNRSYKNLSVTSRAVHELILCENNYHLEPFGKFAVHAETVERINQPFLSATNSTTCSLTHCVDVA